MFLFNQRQRNNSESGGIGLRVLFAIVTLLVIGAVIAIMLQTAHQRQQENSRKAEQISLFGLQTALEKVGAEPAWAAGFNKVPYDGGWYSVSLRRFKEADTMMLELKSEGRFGRTSDHKRCLLSWGDSVWVPRGMH